MPEKHKTIFKQYLWKKEWVRLYESPYSLLLNFCKINVVNFPQAYKMLQISKHQNYESSSYYNTEIGINISIMGVHDMSAFITVLGLKSTPYFTDNTIDSAAYDSLVDFSFRYCPICLKQAGYHSYYHQIYGCSQCFIHKADLVKTNLKYSLCVNPANIFNKWTEPDLGIPGSFTDNMPLPGGRENLEIKEIPNIFPFPVKKIYISNTSHNLEPLLIGELFVRQNSAIKPIKKIQDLTKETQLLGNIFQAMVNHFYKKEGPCAHWEGEEKTYEEKLEAFRHTNNISTYDPREAVLYYKALQLDKKYRIFTKTGEIRHKTPKLWREPISADYMDILAAKFVRLVIGCHDVTTAYSLNWIYYPYGSYSYEPYIYPEFHLKMFLEIKDTMLDINLYTANSPDEYGDTSYNRLRNKNIHAIQVAVINDAFDFLWTQCVDLVRRKQKIEEDELWSMLAVPNYLVVWMENNEVWIYRTTGAVHDTLNAENLI